MKKHYFLLLACLLLATTAKADLGVMYLLANHNSWSMTETGCDLLTETEEGSNIFYNEAITFTSGDYFAIYSQLDTSWGKTYRYAGYSGGEAITPNTATTLYNNATLGWETSFLIDASTAGTYAVYVDMNYSTITLYSEDYSLALPEQVYFFGPNQTGDSWDPSLSAGALTETAEGSGIWTGTVAVESGYLALASALGEDSSDWETLNANRYGPASETTITPDGSTAYDMSYRSTNSWAIAVGNTYTVTADFNELTLVVAIADDEEDAIAGVKADESSTPVAVYSLSGQKLARPTKGIVIQDGKKVLIK